MNPMTVEAEMYELVSNLCIEDVIHIINTSNHFRHFFNFVEGEKAPHAFS
jgi:hypothetical protein